MTAVIFTLKGKETSVRQETSKAKSAHTLFLGIAVLAGGLNWARQTKLECRGLSSEDQYPQGESSGHENI
jgi:hypothetical protein